MCTRMQTWPKLFLVVAATLAAMGLRAAPAQGAAALWISAPTWSYSAALAQSPAGTAYFWGLSVGVNSYSWAYAFSNNGAGSAAFAFAEAAAGGRGGRGGVQVAGLADPYAGVAIDIPLTDPSLPGGYPTSDPATNPFSSAYTVGPTGITLPSESGSELNGDFELEAFVYNGSSTDSGLRSEFGASADSGSTSSGDVTDFSHLTTDLGLIPLDAPIDDPGSLGSIPFTENAGMVDGADDNVVLVGVQTAAPEPASVVLLAGGMISVGLCWRRRRLTA
jgi:hypothetical protein